jgi:hypothetical protein
MRAGLLRALVIAAMIATGCANQSSSLPLKPLGDIPLPGDNSRFDYASLDAQRGLLYVAHLGASEVVEITPSVPVRVDYQLTALGRTLLPVMVGIKDWAEAHMDEVNAAREVYDEARNAAVAAG